MTRLSRLVAVAFVLYGSTALATPTAAERSVAVPLVLEGRARFDAQQYEAALELFKRAHEIAQAPTTGIDLAKTYEALGQLVEARKVVAEVAQMPVEPNEKPIFAESRALAKDAVDALDTRIPLLKLQIVGPPLSATHVSIDGKTLPPEALDKPYPANPGKHTLVVEAPTYSPTELTVTLIESQTTPVDIKLTPVEVQAPPPPTPEPTSKRPVIVGAVGGGLLLVGVGTGIATAMTYQTMSEAMTSYQTANQAFCDASCMTFRQTYEDRRTTLQALSITTMTLGVLGTSAVLYAILDKPARNKADVSFVVAPAPGGVVVQGVW